jgi:hypothetical protein
MFDYNIVPVFNDGTNLFNINRNKVTFNENFNTNFRADVLAQLHLVINFDYKRCGRRVVAIVAVCAQCQRKYKFTCQTRHILNNTLVLFHSFSNDPDGICHHDENGKRKNI